MAEYAEFIIGRAFARPVGYSALRAVPHERQRTAVFSFRIGLRQASQL
jgi:hypothetical protein